MRRRRKAAACLLIACLMAVAAPLEALAQESGAGDDLQNMQQTAANEQTEEKPSDSSQDGEEDKAPAEDKKPDKEPGDKAPEKEKPGAVDKDSQDTSDKASGKKPEKDNSQKGSSEKAGVNTKDEKEETKDGKDKAGGTEDSDEPEETVAIDPDDPGKYRLTGRGTGDFSSAGIKAQAVAHQAKYSDCILQEGVDVSYHNGTINWDKVKADGIDFAIIRVAYRGYENGKLKLDTQAVRNMREANEAGIPIGVYIFSQAVSAAEARQEADFIVRNIEGYQIDLPVVLDFEYVATGVGRLYKAKLSKNAATEVCTAFCSRVKSLGYTPMVYANKTMYKDKTYAADISQEYPIWMAHYNSSTDYVGEFEYWQYSSKGKVDGIRTKNNPYVDMNYRYYNTLRITGSTLSSLSLKWEPYEGADSYDIYRKSGSGAYALYQPEVKGTSFKDTSLAEGTFYSYKIYPHGTDTCIGFNTGITRLTASTKLSGEGMAFDSVKLTWPKVSGASSYYIERYNSSKKAYANIKSVSGKSVSYTDGSRDASTKYKYRIRPYKVVFNGRSFGDYSKAVSVKTKGKVKAQTKSKKLKLLKSASKSAGSLGIIKNKGTRVIVTGSSGSWYKLSTKIGGRTLTGYIKKSSIKLIK